MFQIETTILGKAFIRRLADGACIPNDPKNRDFVEAMAWFQSQGITPDLSDKAPPADPNAAKIAAARKYIKDNWATLSPEVKALAILLAAD